MDSTLAMDRSHHQGCDPSIKRNIISVLLGDFLLYDTFVHERKSAAIPFFCYVLKFLHLSSFGLLLPKSLAYLSSTEFASITVPFLLSVIGSLALHSLFFGVGSGVSIKPRSLPLLEASSPFRLALFSLLDPDLNNLTSFSPSFARVAAMLRLAPVSLFGAQLSSA